MKVDRTDPRWAASLATAALVLVLGWFAFVQGRARADPRDGGSRCARVRASAVQLGAGARDGADGERHPVATAPDRRRVLRVVSPRLAGRWALPRVVWHDAAGRVRLHRRRAVPAADAAEGELDPRLGLRARRRAVLRTRQGRADRDVREGRRPRVARVRLRHLPRTGISHLAGESTIGRRRKEMPAT